MTVRAGRTVRPVVQLAITVVSASLWLPLIVIGAIGFETSEEDDG